MDSLSNNPLAKHFRQPILYVQLPSQGRWWPDGSIELPVTGEIPVYAMTARDEITMKTPDALMNGSSTATVIESCCPNIKDAWKMPLVDLDKLLIAVRLASYGNELEFTCLCPTCETKNEQALDLSVMIDKIGMGNWDTPIKINDLEISLKPQSYEEYNKNNLLNFEEQRIMNLVRDTEMPEDEKTVKFEEMFRKLIETGLGQISRSIGSIKTSEGVVVDNTEYIKEFLNNCDRSVWDAVKKALDHIKSDNASYANINMTCSNEECGKEFVTPFVFEQTNFFG